jgi:DNA-binding transcriptional ArsR family regulator
MLRFSEVNASASAVADPVRREILTLLTNGPLPAGEIASRFTISRPAISRHLRVLREGQLVVAEERGRERLYSLDARPLAELDGWLQGFRAFWDQRLDDLEAEVARAGRERRRTPIRSTHGRSSR